ncbi:MAG: hypothetical protein IT453_08685 [Planctomycetes bacterium]|nr:hypothetical protein [Planctomycetota bacterium]
MFPPLVIALGLGAPFALMLAWLGFARRGPGASWTAPFVAFSGVAVLGLACAAAAVLWGQSKVVPTSGSEGLGWFAFVWGLAAATDAAGLRSEGSRHALRFVVLAVACIQVFGRRLDALAEHGSGLWLALGIAVGATAACELVERLYARVESPIAECAPMAALAGASALSLFAGYATLAAVAGASALAFMVLALGSTRFRTELALRTGGLVFAVGWLVALALAGGLFASPKYPPSLWALVAFGLLAPAIVSLRAFESFGPRGRFVLAAVLALAPIALAAWSAYGTYAPNPYG